MTTAYEPNVVLSTKEYDVVGTRPIRHDGVDKVTGAAKYGADFYASNMLFAKVLRSPHAHARIKSIDTTDAESLEGVRAVVTSKDFGNLPWTYERDQVMASHKVLYKGHPIAGVAAINSHIADHAISLIKVEYECLASVATVHEAMKENAPILLDDLRTEDDLGNNSESNTNVAKHIQYSTGDIEKGFNQADLIVEREFNTATVHQGYIEPSNFTVNWNQDGRLHIWLSSQGPFEIRGDAAKVLGIPVSNVKVTPMEIGGGFGAKFSVFSSPIAALLSKKTGHPVKVVNTRTEEFESSTPTPGSYLKVKIGITKSGQITSGQAYLAYEAGAYPGSPVGGGANCLFAPYDIPNQLIDGYDVVVNKPKTGAYRAPGSPNAAFAIESIVDELAEKLGMDPLNLRLMNASKSGTRRSDGVKFPRIGCIEVIEAMKSHPHYSTPLKGPNQGRGIAIGYWMNGAGESSITLTVHPDGHINLVEGSADIGGSRASISMMAAEVLGIPAESVHPSVVDTDSVGYTSGTGGSSVTHKAGIVVYQAASDVKLQLLDRAASIWGTDSNSLEMNNGVISSTSNHNLKISFEDLAAQLNDTGGPIVGRAALTTRGPGGAFAGHIIDVEVDPETGKVAILRCTAFQDCGKAIHPSYVEGQMQGGTVQGIGWALNEEYFMNEDGSMANGTFLDYRMPLALDLPMIDTVIVEVANPDHPFGVRGVGEVSIAPPLPAVANAVYGATGIRMNRLPMTPASIANITK
tara:strand:+ start:1606 stop:3849 length:2244 start_codon:yes stop_codon:yes gene_type:complete